MTDHSDLHKQDSHLPEPCMMHSKTVLLSQQSTPVINPQFQNIYANRTIAMTNGIIENDVNCVS